MATTPADVAAAVDMRGQHVVVERSALQAGMQPHTPNYIHASLSLFFDPGSHTAFSKLRLADGTDGNMLFYLHLRPEQITSLAVDRSNTKNPELARLCGSSARGSIALRLTLDVPGAIIGPPDWPLPSVGATQKFLDDLKYLAAQTNLVLHVPTGVMIPSQLRSLCLAFSSHGLLSTSLEDATTAKLYEGRGGKVLELLDAAVHGVESPSLAPPAYDPPAGPSRAQQESVEPRAPSKKRRRESTGSTTASPTPEVSESPHASRAPELEADPDVEAPLAALGRSARLTKGLQSYIEALCAESMDLREKRLEERMAKREADLRAEFRAELKSTEARIMASLQDMDVQIEARLTDLFHEEYSDYASKIDLEDVIDDRVAGIKIEMEEFVQDEMLSAEERIIDHFESGTFHATFRRCEDD